MITTQHRLVDATDHLSQIDTLTDRLAELEAVLNDVLDTDTMDFLKAAEPHPSDERFTIAIQIAVLRRAAAALESK